MSRINYAHKEYIAGVASLMPSSLSMPTAIRGPYEGHTRGTRFLARGHDRARQDMTVYARRTEIGKSGEECTCMGDAEEMREGQGPCVPGAHWVCPAACDLEPGVPSCCGLAVAIGLMVWGIQSVVQTDGGESYASTSTSAPAIHLTWPWPPHCPSILSQLMLSPHPDAEGVGANLFLPLALAMFCVGCLNCVEVP